MIRRAMDKFSCFLGFHHYRTFQESLGPVLLTWLCTRCEKTKVVRILRDVAIAPAPGASTEVARSDHVHEIGPADSHPLSSHTPIVTTPQSGHVVPFIDQNAQWFAALWDFQNLKDDPRADNGQTQLSITSNAKSSGNQNRVALASGASGGASSILVTSASGFVVGYTVVVYLDNGNIHITKITSVVSTTIGLGVVLPSAAAGGNRVSVSRTSTLTVAAVSGDTDITVANTMALTGGEVIRIQRDDGSIKQTTVNGTPTGSVVHLNAAVGGAAAIGNYVYVGTHDIDPNFAMGRKIGAPVAGDILAGWQFMGPRVLTSGMPDLSVIYTQVYGVIVEPNPGSGLKGELRFATADNTNSGSPADRFHIGLGLFSQSLDDPGAGRANFTGLKLNNAEEFQFLRSQTASLNFSSVSAGGAQQLTVSVPGAKAAYDLAFTNNPFTAGDSLALVFSCLVTSDDVVTVTALNFTASPIDPDPATFRVTVLGVARP